MLINFDILEIRPNSFCKNNILGNQLGHFTRTFGFTLFFVGFAFIMHFGQLLYNLLHTVGTKILLSSSRQQQSRLSKGRRAKILFPNSKREKSHLLSFLTLLFYLFRLQKLIVFTNIVYYSIIQVFV